MVKYKNYHYKKKNLIEAQTQNCPLNSQKPSQRLWQIQREIKDV